MKKTIFFLLFIAIGLTSCNRFNIESTEKVKEFITGQWHDEIVDRGGLITYYRFEVTETEIKCWKKISILGNNGHFAVSDNNWTEQTPVVLSIGSVQTDSYQNKYRDLGNCSYGRFWFEKGHDGGNRLYFKDSNTSEGDYHTGNLDRGWEY